MNLKLRRSARVGIAIAGAIALAGLSAPSSTSAAPSPPQPSTAQGVNALSALNFRVVDQNVQKKSGAIQAALAEANSVNAQGIALQEVCLAQMKAIRDAHPNWTVVWNPGNVSAHCKDPITGASTRNGNVAIWTGGANGSQRVQVFDHQVFAPDLGVTSEAGIGCVLFQQSYRLCSTHLAVAHGTDTTKQQALEVKQFTNDWVDAGHVVIVAGDFNDDPNSETMDYLYANQGNGKFFEVSRNSAGDVCRCGAFTNVTSGGFERKIDYIFVSQGSWVAARTSSVSATWAGSDHKMLSATARINAP